MLDARMDMGPAEGSSWYIEDTHGTRRKVVVHKPHKVTRTTHVMLRSFGHRFTKHFGWNRDTFVLSTKEDMEEEQA